VFEDVGVSYILSGGRFFIGRRLVLGVLFGLCVYRLKAVLALVVLSKGTVTMWRAAADAGLMCDKAVLIGDTIKGTSVSIYLLIFMTY
jgi:hypothetical protein